MAQASTMSEIKEEVGSQSATERAELSEKEHAHEINNTYSQSGAVDGVGDQALSANKENTVRDPQHAT